MIRLILTAAATLLLGMPSAALACSCISGGPPCQDFFNSDAVFVGTVTGIAQGPARVADIPTERRHVTLSVQRAARGVTGAAVEVSTGLGGGDCGFDFRVGERYIVYARKTADGSLSVSICSRTRRLAEAGEDLAYLDAMPTSAAAGTVSGTIEYFNPRDPTAPAKRTPVGDVQVLVRGSSGVFSGMSGTDGHYTIARVPPGVYEFQVLPPPGFSRRFLGGGFELRDPRACHVRDFGLQYDGHVTGTLVDGSRRPVSGLAVDIAPADRPDDRLLDARSTSDAFGRFELTDVPPGRYIVGIGLDPGFDPPTLYARTLYADPEAPGKSRSLEIGAGERLDIGELRVSEPLVRYELRGVVTDASGAPVAGASVYLAQRFRQATNPVETATDGSFLLHVFEGQTYTLRASHRVRGDAGPRQAQGTATVTISGPPAPVRVTLVVR
jgi:Carboxypeptidase regulatory-like domain